MPNYQKSKIYKLVSNETNDIYIGSTTQRLCGRIAGHRRDAKNQNTYSSYQIVKYDDCKIILIENFPCNNKEELLKRERYYIENNKCVNKRIPGRTVIEYRKEYYEDNKDMIKEKKKRIL